MKAYAKKTEKGIEILGYVYQENEYFDSVGIVTRYLEQRCRIEGETNKEIITKEIQELISLSNKFAFETDTLVDTLIDNYCNNETYDVQFNDSECSNSKGFALSLEDAKAYIERYNGTKESYFADYKGGMVSVVCNETGKTVYETEVK